jgi:hypothetical protein
MRTTFMSPVFKNTAPPAISAQELLDEVGKYDQGVDALSLGNTLVARSYHPYAIQRAIQLALDRGDLELGPKLRLQRAEIAV